MSNRCGWCLSDDHEHCVIVIEMRIPQRPAGPHVPKLTLYPYYWRCSCQVGEHPKTKCLDCQRRGVEVDQRWRCVDREDCQRFIKERGPYEPPRPKNQEDKKDD